MSAGDKTFSVPIDCLPGIAEVYGGQYPDFHFTRGEITILDIGANCGAWSMLMRQRHPAATIHAYEPHPGIFPLLVGNVGRYGVLCHEVAVGDPARTRFFPGADTDLCGSQYQIGRQVKEGITVATRDAGALPRAEVVKVDVEGAEVDVVSRLVLPEVLILEWHSQENRRACEVFLKGMDLVYCRVFEGGWGVSAYLRPQGGDR